MDLNERKHHSENGDWEWFKEFAGIGMPSNYYTFHLISRIMTENPQIQRIVELGTYWGSMAVYFGLIGIRRDIPVVTLDKEDQVRPRTKKLFEALSIAYRVMDIFEHRDVVKHVLALCPTYLICDNGNKADEFYEFGRALTPGSVISVHDYGTEFYDEDARRLSDIRSIEPFHPEEWTKHNVQFATWKIVE